MDAEVGKVSTGIEHIDEEQIILKTAVVVPAYNEADRIVSVLRAVTQAKFVDEIIVVSDGSRDATVEMAKTFPQVKVIELLYNRGKGAAMCAGVKETNAEIIAFVDADLLGLKPEHVDQIIFPILEQKAGMCIGIFRGGQFLSTTAQRISPYISGQRALQRSLFESIPYLQELRFGVEVAINTWAKRLKVPVKKVVLRGVSNTFKEQKMGVVKGTAARAKMYAEIGRAIVRTHRKQKNRKRRTYWI